MKEALLTARKKPGKEIGRDAYIQGDHRAGGRQRAIGRCRGKRCEKGVTGLLLLHPDGHFLRVNNALCFMLGYSEEELQKKTFAEITHPDDIAASKE